MITEKDFLEKIKPELYMCSAGQEAAAAAAFALAKKLAVEVARFASHKGYKSVRVVAPPHHLHSQLVWLHEKTGPITDEQLLELYLNQK